MTLQLLQRSQNNQREETGPVIATIENFEQKQKLVKAKNSLKNIEQYKKVNIENDYAPVKSKSDSNLRTILEEIGKEKQYQVSVGKVYAVRQANGVRRNKNEQSLFTTYACTF